MSKLAEEGIMWLDDSEAYVADMRLFATAEDFLRAILEHIHQLIDDFSEQECGWYKAPRLKEYITKVRKSWMVHRVNSEWHGAPFWENVDEPGCGHVLVWFIDFEV